MLLNVISKIFIIIILLFFFSFTTIHASEIWFEYNLNNSGQFLTKVSTKCYIPIAFPSEPGTIYTVASKKILFNDEFLHTGYQKQNIHQFNYNQNAAEVLYYILKEETLPKQYSSINANYITYTREDLIIDINFPYKKWNIKTGCRLIKGSNLFSTDIHDGIARNSKNSLFSYDFNSYQTIWESYKQDIGYGFGYYFSMNYQFTDTLSFSLSGDDLASKIVWSEGIDEYRGIIDLDIVKSDNNGITYVESPFRGSYFNENSSFNLRLSPLWRGEIQYKSERYQLKNWIQYHNSWKLGIKASIALNQLPDLSLGVLYQANSLTYLLGFTTPYIKAELAMDSFKKGKTTNFMLNIQTHLF
ncbi:MAG: hypothetical protein KAX49_13845 [Halanaerobiales bacterium]|nr:hypothetical protein [Halanaerobiales bacterium]